MPEYFLCPITGCIMRQPAMTPEGVTYDYDALMEWLSSKQTDPSTNMPLAADQLCPNRALLWQSPACGWPAPVLTAGARVAHAGTVRSMIEDFIAKGPDFLMQSTK